MMGDVVTGLKVEFVGGENDGMWFQHVSGDEGGYWISESFPGQKFKQVFVPLDMECPAFVGNC